mmetsp:Transcript_22488/g.44928  ORF Transcript_22488/g.44928 Transcript_22488/m.44928 type:complete len:238 (+) Transcript_22488:108-821(+)
MDGVQTHQYQSNISSKLMDDCVRSRPTNAGNPSSDVRPRHSPSGDGGNSRSDMAASPCNGGGHGIVSGSKSSASQSPSPNTTAANSASSMIKVSSSHDGWFMRGGAPSGCGSNNIADRGSADAIGAAVHVVGFMYCPGTCTGPVKPLVSRAFLHPKRSMYGKISGWPRWNASCMKQPFNGPEGTTWNEYKCNWRLKLLNERKDQNNGATSLMNRSMSCTAKAEPHSVHEITCGSIAP